MSPGVIPDRAPLKNLCANPKCNAETKGEFCDSCWRSLPREMRQEYLAEKKNIQRIRRITPEWRRVAGAVLDFLQAQERTVVTAVDPENGTVTVRRDEP